MQRGRLTRDVRRVLNTKDETGAPHTELVLIQHFQRHLVLLRAGSSCRRKQERHFDPETPRTPACLGPVQPQSGTLGLVPWPTWRTFAVRLCSGTRPGPKFSLSQTKSEAFLPSIPQRGRDTFIVLFFLLFHFIVVQSLYHSPPSTRLFWSFLSH